MFRPSTINARRYTTTLLIAIPLMLLLSGCATYYQTHVDFNREFEKGDLEQALANLEKNHREGNGRNRFLYFANQGLLLSIMGRYEESNSFFEKAFLFGEDFRVNYLTEAASYLTNPTYTVYRGEDHEHLMVLYFKAINFLKMNKPEEALVECRRLNIRLNQLNDKYTSEEKLQRDAFIHNLMGIIYQSGDNYNDAFIAYRNAYDTYKTDYARILQVEAPEQLKYDLMNTAYWTGFQEEFEHYRQEFNMPDYTPTRPDAELVFFWHNGLAPIKDEWSVNFVINHANDMVVFASEQLGVISFPYRVDNEKDKADLKKLEVFRVAFPRYVERPVYFGKATLTTSDSTYALALTEDLSKVAFYSLKQRMLQEFGKTLLRTALKKAAEHSMRKEDERLGAVIGLVNAMTEKADTRNWQTLPHSIYYARVPLKSGDNEVSFSLYPQFQAAPTPYHFKYAAKKGQTLFHTFSSLEALPPAYRYY